MSRIKSATEITKDSATYLIYGSQGSGKTTSLKYLPGKTLILDIDKSSSVLAGEEHIDILEIDTSNTWEDWISVVTDIIAGKINTSTYDTIAVDNVTELFRSALEDLGKKGKATQDGVPGMADYQKIDFMLLRSLRGLNSLNKRIVFTAWETTDLWTHESGQSFNRSMPELRKTINNNFMGLCDVIAKITSKVDNDDKITRGFILQPSDSVMAKNRLDDRKGCKVQELVQEVKKMTEIEELNKYKIYFKHANGAPDIDSVYAESEYDAEDKFILSQEYEIVEVTKLEKVNGI